MTSAWAGGGVLGGKNSTAQRNFAKIIEDEKSNRNILEIQLVKIVTENEGVISKPRPLTYDDLGELLFDILKIDPSHCLGFDYNSGRFDTKQIKLKPGVDTKPYVTDQPINFKEHSVSVRKQMSNITRVTFKNVPLNVPDEEIVHLCLCYGKPVDMKVHYETLTNTRNKGMTGSTRYVDMELNKGAVFENYYWLEGPLSGDQGRRILVLHNNQESQCSHCLRKSSTGCPGQGNGKACEQIGTPRGKMFLYMQSLRAKLGYISMKTMYMEDQARNFPSLNGTEEVRSEMTEDEDLVVPMNPIELKDKQIAALKKNVEDFKTKDTEIDRLKEALTKTNAELKVVKKNFHTSQQKLNFTKKATENVLVENISNPTGYIEDPVLIGVYSATLNEDEIDIKDDDESDDSRSRKDIFLKSMEEKIDLSNAEHKERYIQIKNKILEKVKATKTSRSRSRSTSVTSTSSKRALSGEKDNGRSPVRARSSQLPIKT